MVDVQQPDYTALLEELASSPEEGPRVLARAPSTFMFVADLKAIGCFVEQHCDLSGGVEVDSSI